MNAIAAKRNKLDIAMTLRERRAMLLLKEIEGLIHDLPAPESDGLNWGHVGSMGHVGDMLSEIKDFLK